MRSNQHHPPNEDKSYNRYGQKQKPIRASRQNFPSSYKNMDFNTYQKMQQGMQIPQINSRKVKRSGDLGFEDYLRKKEKGKGRSRIRVSRSGNKRNKSMKRKPPVPVFRKKNFSSNSMKAVKKGNRRDGSRGGINRSHPARKSDVAAFKSDINALEYDQEQIQRAVRELRISKDMEMKKMGRGENAFFEEERQRGDRVYESHLNRGGVKTMEVVQGNLPIEQESIYAAVVEEKYQSAPNVIVDTAPVYAEPVNIHQPVQDIAPEVNSRLVKASDNVVENYNDTGKLSEARKSQQKAASIIARNSGIPVSVRGLFKREIYGDTNRRKKMEMQQLMKEELEKQMQEKKRQKEMEEYEKKERERVENERIEKQRQVQLKRDMEEKKREEEKTKKLEQQREQQYKKLEEFKKTAEISRKEQKTTSNFSNAYNPGFPEEKPVTEMDQESIQINNDMHLSRDVSLNSKKFGAGSPPTQPPLRSQSREPRVGNSHRNKLSNSSSLVKSNTRARSDFVGNYPDDVLHEELKRYESHRDRMTEKEKVMMDRNYVEKILKENSGLKSEVDKNSVILDFLANVLMKKNQQETFNSNFPTHHQGMIAPSPVQLSRQPSDFDFHGGPRDMYQQEHHNNMFMKTNPSRQKMFRIHTPVNMVYPKTSQGLNRGISNPVNRFQGHRKLKTGEGIKSYGSHGNNNNIPPNLDMLERFGDLNNFKAVSNLNEIDLTQSKEINPLFINGSETFKNNIDQYNLNESFGVQQVRRPKPGSTRSGMEPEGNQIILPPVFNRDNLKSRQEQYKSELAIRLSRMKREVDLGDTKVDKLLNKLQNQNLGYGQNYHSNPYHY